MDIKSRIWVYLFGMMNDGTSEMKIIQFDVGPNDINALMQIVALHIFSEEQSAPWCKFISNFNVIHLFILKFIFFKYQPLLFFSI